MKWFDAKALANESNKLADIKLYSDIGGYGITAGNFIKEVQSFGDVDTIKVSINSTGGSVVDAIAITNFLIYHKAHVIIQIDGIAASAASLIAMAGNEIIMPENAMMMVHYPWTDLQGNAEEIRATAEALDRMGEAMAGTYARKTGQTKEQIHALLRDEKWLSAQECLELGFCTKIVEPITAKSAAHIENLNLPQAAKHLTMQAQASIAEDHTPDEDTDVNELLGDGTEPEPQAPETPLTDLDDDDEDIEAIIEEAVNNSLEYSSKVVELCVLAGLPNKAAAFLTAKASLADIGAELLKAKASGQQHLETYQQPATATALPLAGDIYSKRNKQ